MKIPGLGALRFHLFTRPRDAWDALLARRRLPAMRAAIDQLHPLPPLDPDTDASEITYLSGRAFLYLTVYSAYSLRVTAGRPLRFRIVDDGTLTGADLALLHRLFPNAIVHESPAEITARLDEVIPTERFPSLRTARTQCALFRKLADVHAGQIGWRLFLDSDTYFHRRPDALLTAVADASAGCYMRDHWSNYGHPPDHLAHLSGGPVLARVNSGVIGLHSESIDWMRLESWLTRMIADKGRFVFFEQGLHALLLSSGPAIELPPADYILAPERSEVRRPRAAFHHYAGGSRNRFIRFGVPRPLFAPTLL